MQCFKTNNYMYRGNKNTIDITIYYLAVIIFIEHE